MLQKVRDNPWAPLLAFVILALVGGYALEEAADNNAQELAEAVIESCERVNVLREEVNTQTSVIQDLVTFVADNAAAEDPERARQYREYAEQMMVVPLVDCPASFPQFSIGVERRNS